MASSPPTIFIAIPVYHGWDFLPETLRSIKEQDYREWRACISVDGADERSAEVCRTEVAGDERFSIVVQSEQLGWARNLNWLMDRCDAGFYCYWQQDDLCAQSYLRVLHEHIAGHPEAVCAFSDLQWFGSRVDRVEMPSLTGFALERVRAQVEHSYYNPFRGLIRKKALDDAGRIRVNAHISALQDLAWLVRLACEGEFHRVPGTLYFKRSHPGNLHARWHGWPPAQRRAAWLDFGCALLVAALPAVPARDHPRLMRAILGRIALARPGRFLLYDSAQEGNRNLLDFTAEFIAAAEAETGILSLSDIAGAQGMTRNVLASCAPVPGSLASLIEASRRGDAVADDGAGLRLIAETRLRELTRREGLWARFKNFVAGRS